MLLKFQIDTLNKPQMFRKGPYVVVHNRNNQYRWFTMSILKLFSSKLEIQGISSYDITIAPPEYYGLSPLSIKYDTPAIRAEASGSVVPILYMYQVSTVSRAEMGLIMAELGLE